VVFASSLRQTPRWMKAEADRALAKTRRIRETAANANPLISRSNAAADLEAKLKGKERLGFKNLKIKTGWCVPRIKENIFLTLLLLNDSRGD
jgi:hypothetical protein